MEKILFQFLCLTALIASCTNKNSNAIEMDKVPIVKIDTGIINNIKDSTIKPKVLPDFTPIWDVDTTNYEYEKIVKLRKLDSINLSIENVLKIVNNQMESKCVFDKIRNNTIYIKIPNSESLTQSHGSSGGLMRMKLMVFTFTEIPNIAKVHLEFEEGDHAVLGTYIRKDFK